MTIRAQLIGYTVSIILLVGGSISLSFMYLGRQRILTTFTREAGDLTALLADVIASDLYSLDIDALGRRLRAARLNPHVSATHVMDLEGVVLADGTADNLLRDERFTDSWSQEILRSDGWVSRIEGGTLKVGGPIVLADGSRIGYLNAAFSLDRPRGIARETTRSNLVLTAICLGIGAGLAVLLGTRFSRPLVSIMQASRQIGEGQLDTRVRIQRNDEFGLLAEAINQMGLNLSQITVSKDYLDNIIRSMISTLIVANPDGTIRAVNRVALGLLGYGEDELIGKPVGMVFASGEVFKGSGRDDLTTQGLVRTRETTYVTKDGTTIPVLLSTSAMRNDDGTVQGILYVAQDIIERKQAERALQRLYDELETRVQERTRDLSRANESLQEEIAARMRSEAQLRQAQAALVAAEKLRGMGEMAAGVAHDFNNVLAVVLGQVLTLREALRQGPVPPETVREKLRLLEQAALDGAETVRKIREATRAPEETTFAPVELNAVVTEVLATTRPRWKDQAEAHGLRLTITTVLAEVPPVQGDAAELREALTNLLFNALDALEAGGTLTIATRVAHEGSTTVPGSLPAAPGDVVELTVTDTGVGMAAAVQARLFEPFFTTKGVKGSGLGLSMVHGIVRRHGGTIRVESAEGQGTTVTLRLPVAPPAAIPARPPADGPALPGPLRILTIDDEPLLAQTLAEILRALGHEATATTSGPEGLAALARAPIDLVLTDLGMPELSGWDVALAVKARWPHLPVVLVTGWGDQIGTELLAATGVDLVLPKPFTKAELQAALAHAWALGQEMSAR